MNFLYLDNIRGFSNTVIPFRQVTFLVGENSTGKSTVLSALHLMTKEGWFSDLDFDADEYHMGGFDDLVTAGSETRDEFTIGINKDVGDSRNFKGYIFLSFRSDDGLPVVSRISYVDHELLISLNISKKSVSFRMTELSQTEVKNFKLGETSIKQLAVIHKEKDPRHFSNLEVHDNVISQPQHLLMMANHLIGRAKTLSRPLFEAYYYIYSSSNTAWIAPIRAKPKRTYDVSKGKFDAEGSHTPYLIRKHMRSSKSRSRTMLNKFGLEGHLFDTVQIKPFGEGDYGPFEVQIGLGESRHSIANVGYGVSQALPILVEGIVRDAGATLFIQQPEVHLHPRAQASLGSLLWRLADEDKKSLIVETHSDYVVDRMRREMSSKDHDVDCSVLFFERGESGNHVTEILITKDGRFPKDQPESFRRFFIDEQMSILGL